MIRIHLCKYPEWDDLLAAKLTSETPLADEDVQDDDPECYRQDRRIYFCAFPNKRFQTHQAVLVCHSNDKSYQLSFELVELPDARRKREVVVYRRGLLKNQRSFVFNTNDLSPRSECLNPNVDVEVCIGIVKFA